MVREKGKKEVVPFTNAFIEHGKALEPIIRDWFKASYLDTELYYKENAILHSKNMNGWHIVLMHYLSKMTKRYLGM